MAVETHKLGFGYGTITDNGDGTASYRKPVEFTQSFRVRIADVTGFSVSRGSKALERTLKILGNGTELASCSVNHGASEKIEAWFRAHPAFGAAAGRALPEAAAPAAGALDSRLIADELTKLAGLRDAGVLTEDEFAAQKAKLLG
ncbi:SHOCT domain-containing protein [Arthrobacter sp. 162MFSha1.1]|uniref:SHOCT domain-containing protein n=1 Tax=Arthrobacter sp. 162MFSha1.1 TaxID=1151119 RepID=UPI0003624575|nr:SHOCT domain-containing protein [Arthrobacter sp. 162MFSha1.1]